MINKEVYPTWIIALKVWWAWGWRSMLTVLLLSTLFGMFLGFFGAIMGIAQNVISPLAGISGMVIGLYFSVYFIKRLMTKGFGKYRLVVIEKEDLNA